MKLNYILCFDKQITNTEKAFLTKKLKEQDIYLIWTVDRETTQKLTPDNCLIVTENQEGIDFATAHHYPYIEKWSEAPCNPDHKPVCYYDLLNALTPEYFINQWKRSHHLPLVIAHSKRLELRELSLTDIPTLYEIKSEPSVACRLPKQSTLEEETEKHKAYISCQYEFFDYGLWGIFDKEQHLIGQAGIQNAEYNGTTMLELSYLIASKYQRNGYATEAVLAIYDYVTSSLEQNSILAIIAKNNLPSIRFAMNLGMKRKEDVSYHGFDCNYYLLLDIHDFLIRYKSEQKRTVAAKSAFERAKRHPVQEVYSRYRN